MAEVTIRAAVEAVGGEDKAIKILTAFASKSGKRAAKKAEIKEKKELFKTWLASPEGKAALAKKK